MIESFLRDIYKVDRVGTAVTEKVFLCDIDNYFIFCIRLINIQIRVKQEKRDYPSIFSL